jgi:hypothetical protein
MFTIEHLRETIKSVVTQSSTDIITYSGPISEKGQKQLANVVNTFSKFENGLLILSTFGGDPDCAYRIARSLQKTYKRFTLFVPSICKSAGTLIALGANEIVMGKDAELGPLDIQLSKPDALAERTSGLTPRVAIETLQDSAFEALEAFFLKLRLRSGLQITTRTALEVATDLTGNLYRPVFQQIDPMRIGEVSRAMLIAKEYGTRLAERSGNHKPETLDRLVESYPSHGFVIDVDEAKELFLDVREPNEGESTLAVLLEAIIHVALETDEAEVSMLNTLLTEKPLDEDENEVTDAIHDDGKTDNDPQNLNPGEDRESGEESSSGT